MENNNPANIDREELLELYTRYGGELVHGRLDQLGSGLGFHAELVAPLEPGDLDEFAVAGVTKPEDIRDRFLNHFYFGTESDDTRVAQAFNRKANPYGDAYGGQSQRVKAFLGSDSGHWDVPNITAIAANTYSMVERKIITEEDLQYFLSIHPLELYTSLNRDFFKGTAVEKAADEFLAGKLR